MRYQIGVIGSAEDFSPEVADKARHVGRAIADYNCTLITGAAIGLPYEAILGARERRGLTIGIAPAMNEDEQLKKFKFKPDYFRNFDVMIYTGSGYKGRNVVNMRSCHGVVLVAGGIGSLNEVTTAYGEGKLIAVLKGTGGLADELENIFTKLRTKVGQGEVIYHTEPEELVSKLVIKLNKTKKIPQ